MLTNAFFATRVIPHPNLHGLMIRIACINRSEHISLASVLRAYLSQEITHLDISPHEALQACAHSAEAEAHTLVSILRPFRDSIEFWGFAAFPSFYAQNSPAGAIFESLFDDVPCTRHVRIAGPLMAGRKNRTYRWLSSYLFDRTPAPPDSRGLPHRAWLPVMGSWGRGVRQVRIEAVNVPALIVDRIQHAHSPLADLRVRVIAPLSAAQASLRLDHPYTKARKIAAGILVQRLPRLRVVVVEEDRFWLEFPDLFGGGPRRVWDLSKAVGDARQAIDVARCLNRRDWRFLNGQDGLEGSSMVIRREGGTLRREVRTREGDWPKSSWM